MIRKLFTTFAVAALAATMLVGCTPKADDPNTPPASTDAVIKTDQAPKPDAVPPATPPDKTPATTTPAPAPGSKPK